MLQDGKILIGKGENPVYLLPGMSNRHGLIAGATGTGKTTTLKVLAEGFSDLGVPVFLADIKGDVSGTVLPGEDSDKVRERLQTVGVDPAAFQFTGYPCRFWDVLGKGGIPVRATVTEVGPVLLSRLLNLSDVQEGVLNIAFRVADDNGWELIDFKDLRAMLGYLGEHREEYTITYGNVTTQSVGAIQRALLALENDGAVDFFGEPDLDIADWFQVSEDGRGMVNILHAEELYHRPLLYATFMLWMLSELFERMPEVGDQEKPRLVFFFDEAHLLFNNAPRALVEKIVQVVKLIRSKGVGVFFITQSPADIPDEVLAQLNNRIQHAMRAYTPAEQKAVRTAAQSFRANPNFKTEDAISNMGTGVALVSTLDEAGVPGVVEQTVICPPQSSLNGMELVAKVMLVTNDALYGKYKDLVDDYSAYEILTEEAEAKAAALAAEEARKAAEKAALAEQKAAEKAAKAAEKAAVAEQKAAEKAEKEAEKAALAEQKAAEKAAREEEKALQAQYKAEGKDKYGRTKMQQSIVRATRNTAKSVGRKAAKTITRGILGNSNKTVSSAAGQFAGNIISDIIGGFIK